jgi:hypothetical protein
MGQGPNYVLDKPFLATGSTAYTAGLIGQVQVGSGTQTAVANAIALAGATPTNLLVVVQEDLDTVRLGYGKAYLDCRVIGIARVQVGAAVTALARVTSDSTSRAVAVTRAVAGAQPVLILGIALTTATAAGQFIDVLVIPGATF